MLLVLVRLFSQTPNHFFSAILKFGGKIAGS